MEGFLKRVIEEDDKPDRATKTAARRLAIFTQASKDYTLTTAELMATLQAAYNTFGDNWGATWSDHKKHLTMLDAALVCVHEDINVGETAVKYKQYLAAKNSINELTRIVTATQRCVERILMAQTFE